MAHVWVCRADHKEALLEQLSLRRKAFAASLTLDLNTCFQTQRGAYRLRVLSRYWGMSLECGNCLTFLDFILWLPSIYGK